MRGLKNFILALIQGAIVLYFIENFGKFIWPKVLYFMQKYELAEWQFSVFFSWVYNAGVFFLSNIFFMCIYKLNHPFFEQYKV